MVSFLSGTRAASGKAREVTSASTSRVSASRLDDSRPSDAIRSDHLPKEKLIDYITDRATLLAKRADSGVVCA